MDPIRSVLNAKYAECFVFPTTTTATTTTTEKIKDKNTGTIFLLLFKHGHEKISHLHGRMPIESIEKKVTRKIF
jgi:hypothetical protein